MNQLLWVCLGSALGGGARYLVCVGASRWIASTLPVGTLLVNLVGSFLIGLIMRVAFGSTLISPTARLFLTTGIMGGLTTYSTFNYETIELVRKGTLGLALLNLGSTLTGCLLAGVGGLALGGWILR